MTWRLAVCGILLVVSVAAASQWKVLFDGQPFPRIWGTNPLPDRALAGDGAFFSQSSPEIKVRWCLAVVVVLCCVCV